MAKRFIDTDLWDKDWFMELTPKLKCLVIYARAKCDLAGILTPNWKLACMCIGEDVNQQDLTLIDSGSQFIKTDEGKIFCEGFIDFQYGEKLNPKSPVHEKVIAILTKNNYEGYTLLDRVLNRVCNTTKEEEEESKEEDKDKEKEEGKPKKKSEKIETISYRSNIKLSATENEKLIAEHGHELTDKFYDHLSSYKIERGYTTKSDYLTIGRWVVDAVTKKLNNANSQTHGSGVKPGTSTARINAIRNWGT